MTDQETELRALASEQCPWGIRDTCRWAVQEIDRLRLFYESSQEALKELIQEHTACQGALEAANALIRELIMGKRLPERTIVGPPFPESF